MTTTTQPYRFQGFTVEELLPMFNRLTDPADWKSPIQATVPGELVLLAVAAIQFYTATTPTVRCDTATMRYQVSSIGYRQGPAGDH